MFVFNLKKTAVFNSIRWADNPIFKFSRFFKKLSSVLFIFTFLIFLYGFLPENFPENTNAKLLGFSIIFLIFFVFILINNLFFEERLKQPGIDKLEEAIQSPGKHNLAEFLSFESAKAVSDSIKFAKSKKVSSIISLILLYFILKNNPKLKFVFYRALLDFKGIKKILFELLRDLKREKFEEFFSDDFQKTISDSLMLAQKRGHERIEVSDLISALAKNDLVFRKILINSNLKPEDIENISLWQENLEKEIVAPKKFWEWHNLVKRGSLAKEWASGYTVTLDRFSTDISETVRKRGFPEIVGRKKEIKEIERALARGEPNNVLVVGEDGSGRKSVVHSLVRRSMSGAGLPEINFKRFVQLDLHTILAQNESIEEVESVLDNIFKEVVLAGNVILVIDEFHNFVGSNSLRPGTIDISGIISPYLPLDSFQVVAVTTYEGLHKNIELNPSLLSFFEKVEVGEILEKETLMILENFALVLEIKHKKFISFSALSQIIKLCDKYFSGSAFPEKAMDLLEEAVIYLAQKKEKILLPKHVAKVVMEKTQIPVGEIESKERDILLNLENLIHQRIINQSEAVDDVASALRRARSEVMIRKGPMGCFLFLGPTGVGKTETSKALAEIYFGSEQRMIRLDMSEFQSVSDIVRLIGSTEQKGILTTMVREAPFSLVLLDEIEKSHPNILNLFLQVLDEGFLTDGLGRKVDFRNTIIIATSNAGYQIILDALKRKIQWQKVKEKLLDYIFDKSIFRPEFINRFDSVVLFKPLSKNNLLDIAELILRKLKKNLEEKEIEFVITEKLKEKIVELGYDQTFGARNMQRVIQDNIGNVLAKAILSGDLKRGNRAEIEPSDFSLLIK